MKSINDITHAFYINLASRTDRKAQVEEQLRNVGLTCAQRFNAVKLDDGRVGCSMSHLKCLSIAKENKWPHVLICEDDIEFLKLIAKKSGQKFDRLDKTINPN